MTSNSKPQVIAAVERIGDHLLASGPGRHIAATVASLAALGVVNAALNALYAASNHPVSYAEGQTSFDAGAVKGWYATMSEAGTLDVYVGTQLFDYVFMAALALVGLVMASLLQRLNRPWHPGMTMARIGGLAVVAGTVMDAIENLISFVMLADATGFPDVLVIPYSAAAVAKFIAIGFGMTTLTAAAVTGVARRLLSTTGRTSERPAEAAPSLSTARPGQGADGGP